MRLAARRTLKIVELDDEDLRAFRGHDQRHARLRGKPALELGALIAGRLLRGDGGAGRRRGHRLARKERERRAGAGQEHHGDRDGEGAAGEHAQIVRETAGQRGHGIRGGRTGHEEESDHGGVCGQTQQAHGLEEHEGRVTQIQHDGERQRGQDEQIARNVFAHGLARRHRAQREQDRATTNHSAPKMATGMPRTVLKRLK